MIALDHDDYPALVAEALDQLHDTGYEIAAATGLGVSSSQLIRLFRREPAA